MSKKNLGEAEASPKSVVFFARGEQRFFAVLGADLFLADRFFLSGLS